MPTRHRHLLESTYTDARKNTQTHSSPRGPQPTRARPDNGGGGAGSRRGGAPSSSEESPPRPHPHGPQHTPQRAASPVAISHAVAMCAPPPRGAVPAARATSTSTSSLHAVPPLGQLVTHLVLRSQKPGFPAGSSAPASATWQRWTERRPWRCTPSHYSSRAAPAAAARRAAP